MPIRAARRVGLVEMNFARTCCHVKGPAASDDEAGKQIRRGNKRAAHKESLLFMGVSLFTTLLCKNYTQISFYQFRQ
jgi:hypothetical protein